MMRLIFTDHIRIRFRLYTTRSPNAWKEPIVANVRKAPWRNECEEGRVFPQSACRMARVQGRCTCEKLSKRKIPISRRHLRCFILYVNFKTLLLKRLCKLSLSLTLSSR